MAEWYDDLLKQEANYTEQQRENHWPTWYQEYQLWHSGDPWLSEDDRFLMWDNEMRRLRADIINYGGGPEYDYPSEIPADYVRDNRWRLQYIEDNR